MLSINQGGSFMPGVFIKEATIIYAVDISGKPTYQDNPESIRDLAVEVEFDIGKEWTKKVVFKGNLKLDPKSPKIVTDWGSAFVVKDLFMKTHCFSSLTKEELKEKLFSFSQKDIPADFLLKIKGKKVFILDYVKGISEDGRLKYGTWNIVDTDPDILQQLFSKSVAKGYPGNYKPELLSKSLTELSVSAPTEAAEALIEDDFIF